MAIFSSQPAQAFTSETRLVREFPLPGLKQRFRDLIASISLYLCARRSRIQHPIHKTIHKIPNTIAHCVALTAGLLQPSSCFRLAATVLSCRNCNRHQFSTTQSGDILGLLVAQEPQPVAYLRILSRLSISGCSCRTEDVQPKLAVGLYESDSLASLNKRHVDYPTNICKNIPKAAIAARLGEVA